MKIYSKLIIIFILLFSVLFIIMPLFKLCPPKGPWPEPPWCKIKATNSVFIYSKPEYLQNINLSLNHNFIFGIGMMDLWGKLCVSPFLCENPKKDIETTFNRLKQLNTNLVMVTDFYQIDRNKDILKVNLGGARTINKEDMDFLIKKAHENDLDFMLITNLYEKDNSREVLNFKNPTKEEIDSLFNKWSLIILNQAKKSNPDYLVINPRDIGFFFETKEDNDYIYKKFLNLLPKLRKSYSGKICLWGPNYIIKDYANNYDCVIVDEEIQNLFKEIPQNITQIKLRWDSYLESINYTKPTFILILMPSYDGAMKNGWIEPVGVKYNNSYITDYQEQALIYEGFFESVSNHAQIKGIISYGYWWNDNLYPNTLEIFRNDLSHSIRDKDAEQVFYMWSKEQ